MTKNAELLETTSQHQKSKKAWLPSIIIIQQIVTMPIYGQEIQNMSLEMSLLEVNSSKL